MTDHPLGRITPPDAIHVQRYTLTAATMPDKPTPVIAGTNWYSRFDTPVWDARGRFWIIGRDHRDLGSVRGGHAYCLKPAGVNDTTGWHTYYDQGREGACVGFAISRAMSLLNRRRYDAPWLYYEAQKVDSWPGEDYSGTSVRAGLDVIRERGHRRVIGTYTKATDPAEGISRNRWATSVPDAVAAMHAPRYLSLGRVALANSWGRSWPMTVWMPLETLGRLLAEDGELAVIFDREPQVSVRES